MKKSVVAVILGVVAILAIGILVVMSSADNAEPDQSSTETTQTSESLPEQTAEQPIASSSSESKVEIEDFAFSPASITVKKGTKVTWTNLDSAGHTVTPNSPTAEFAGSGTLDKGESYSVTFDTVGTYSYFCKPHPDMKGKVVVTE